MPTKVKCSKSQKTFVSKVKSVIYTICLFSLVIAIIAAYAYFSEMFYETSTGKIVKSINEFIGIALKIIFFWHR